MYQVIIPEKRELERSGFGMNTISSNEKSAVRDDKMCFICLENERNCLILPCKHNFSCMKCSKNLKKCPIDRGTITDFIKMYNV